MIFLRPMTVLLLLMLVSSILTACEASTTTAVTNTPTPRLLSPEEIAQHVGDAYGEPHVQIAGVRSDVSEAPPHEPLYTMSLTGHFHKGALEAVKLGCSALATRMYVWNIHAYDQADNEVWFDHELAPASP